ncbi:MAG: hypothetical protein ABW321_29085, partial [Polyangiales bacterium]
MPKKRKPRANEPRQTPAALSGSSSTVARRDFSRRETLKGLGALAFSAGPLAALGCSSDESSTPTGGDGAAGATLGGSSAPGGSGAGAAGTATSPSQTGPVSAGTAGQSG